MNYIIVIPSYNREELFLKTTHQLIKHLDCKKYLLTDKEYPYKYIEGYEQQNAPSGIKNVRNYIRNIFNGKKVLCIDDDIIKLSRGTKSGFVDIYNNELTTFIIDCWKRMQKENCYLGGINLHYNSFFCRNGISTNLTYINGSFTFFDLKNNIEPIYINVDHYEDYETSILYFQRDGKICKFCDVCIKTKCYNPVGGICEQLGGLDIRKESCYINGLMMEAVYPEYCKLGYSKKHNCYNLKLKNIKSK